MIYKQKRKKVILVEQNLYDAVVIIMSTHSIYLLTGYEGIASLLSPRLNSQGRGDNKLAIPEYTVYK
jgi:hypothetical protein